MSSLSTLPLAQRMSWIQKSKLGDLLQYAKEPDVISFRDGSPDTGLLPAQDLADVAQHVLLNMTSEALQYGSTYGLARLRQTVAEMMAEDGVTVSADNVVITSGSMQSLDMLSRVLLDPDDLIMVENPTFMAALSGFRSYGIRFAPIPLDQDGDRADLLADLIDQERPKFIYLIPNFQNPMGVSMSLARRQQIVEIAEEKGVLILEDDPYGKLRFGSHRLPTLFELDAQRNVDMNADSYQEGNVVYLGSFSKILAPGLRVAWTLSTPEVAYHIYKAKQDSDYHTSALPQAVVYEYVRRGLLPGNIERVRDAYLERRDIMFAAIERQMPDCVEYTKPDGGLFVWMTLPEQIDAIELLKRGPEFRVAFFPGQIFSVDGSYQNALRLTYASMLPEEIEEGIKRLGNAIRSMM